MLPLFLSLPIILSAAMPGEMSPDVRFPGPDTTYKMSRLNGVPYDKRATLTFPESGRIAGQGPCNDFSGRVNGTPEGMSIEPLVSTQAACPEIEAEQQFFGLLEGMSKAEIAENVVVFSDPEGNMMTFTQDEG